MAQPVVGGNFAGNVQNQAAVGITLVGIGIDAPVELFQIFVDWAFDVNHNLFVGAGTVALVAVQDIGLGSGKIVGGNQNLLDNVLNLLNRRKRLRKFMFQNFQHLAGQEPGFLLAKLVRAGSGFQNSVVNTVAVKRRQSAISFGNRFNGDGLVVKRRFVLILWHILLNSFLEYGFNTFS